MWIARLVILVGLILSASAEASAATAEKAFLDVLKRFGIATTDSLSKKPCLCTGAGGLDGYVGRLVVFKEPSGDGYQFDCSLSWFSPDGSTYGGAPCRASGGTVIVIDK